MSLRSEISRACESIPMPDPDASVEDRLAALERAVQTYAQLIRQLSDELARLEQLAAYNRR